MMILNEKDFICECKKCLKEWYKETLKQDIRKEDIYVVWGCKTLQNYKCLIVLANNNNDNYYAEYTYNGDKEELYQDVYTKISNYCYCNDGSVFKTIKWGN